MLAMAVGNEPWSEYMRLSMSDWPGYGRSKSDAVRMMMIRAKSTVWRTAARSSASKVALSSCAVVQYTPEPFVNRVVVFSKASPRRAPEKYTSLVATSQERIPGG